VPPAVVTVPVSPSIGVGVSVGVGVFVGVGVGVLVGNGVDVDVFVGVAMTVGVDADSVVDDKAGVAEMSLSPPKSSVVVTVADGGPPNAPVTGVAGRVLSGVGVSSTEATSSSTGMLVGTGLCSASASDPRCVPSGTPARKNPMASKRRAKAYAVKARTRSSSRGPCSPILFSNPGDCANKATPKASKAPSADRPIPHNVHSGKPIAVIIATL
jgi:hypothetical protein